MRILKTKVAKAAACLKRKRLLQKAFQKRSKSDQDNQLHEDNSRPKRERRPPPKFSPSIESPPKGSTSCKNIMKNYSKAIVNFALSPIATKYLVQILGEAQIEMNDFRKFVEDHRAGAHCIKGLRALLLVDKKDSDQVAQLKNVFKKISIIFLKYFSVNWIFNSKVADKITHLNYRFKILRRVKNPVYFTYLQDFAS